MATPTFGDAEWWNNPNAIPSTNWQNILSTQAGNLSPEQTSFAQQQVQAGSKAVNPYATGAFVDPFTGVQSGGAGGGANSGGATNYGSQGAPGYTSTISGQPSIAAPAQQTVQTQFRDALLGQLNTDPNNVSLTDPTLAPQARAYQDQQDRATAQLQQDLAEQGFAGGVGHSGAYDQELANARETQAQNVGAFNSNLISQAQNQRLQSLFQALGLGENLIGTEQQNALQGRSLDIQQQLGQSDIGLRSQLGKQQLGLGLLQALLGDRQANDSLGLQAALGSAGINQNALAGLGL